MSEASEQAGHLELRASGLWNHDPGSSFSSSSCGFLSGERDWQPVCAAPCGCLSSGQLSAAFIPLQCIRTSAGGGAARMLQAGCCLRQLFVALLPALLCCAHHLQGHKRAQ
jgi:hypothetical protein